MKYKIMTVSEWAENNRFSETDFPVYKDFIKNINKKSDLIIIKNCIQRTYILNDGDAI